MGEKEISRQKENFIASKKKKSKIKNTNEQTKGESLAVFVMKISRFYKMTNDGNLFCHPQTKDRWQLR